MPRIPSALDLAFHLVARWRKWLITLTGALAGGRALVDPSRLGVQIQWQASEATSLFGNRDYYPDKTRWDWLQLLIVPLAVVGAAGWLNLLQAGREAKRDSQRLHNEQTSDAMLLFAPQGTRRWRASFPLRTQFVGIDVEPPPKRGIDQKPQCARLHISPSVYAGTGAIKPA